MLKKVETTKLKMPTAFLFISCFFFLYLFVNLCFFNLGLLPSKQLSLQRVLFHIEVVFHVRETTSETFFTRSITFYKDFKTKVYMLYTCTKIEICIIFG